jgi:hypothetical protein
MGTARSGSTIFSLSLAAALNALYVGEPYAAFWPHRPGHTTAECHSCSSCWLWPILRQESSSSYALRALDETGRDVLIDSSKVIPWMFHQVRKGSVPVHLLLLYRRPERMKESMEKRGFDVERAYRNFKRQVRFFRSLDVPLVSVDFDEFKSRPADYADKIGALIGADADVTRLDGDLRSGSHVLFGSSSIDWHDIVTLSPNRRAEASSPGAFPELVGWLRDHDAINQDSWPPIDGLRPSLNSGIRRLRIAVEARRHG